MQEKRRVLIFDDDEDLLDIFRFLFEDEGWDVYTYQNCDEVVLHALQISPQLILMDNWIPSVGGVMATQMIKGDERLKQIPVIYISANNEIKDLSESAGADAFIAKPFDFGALIKMATSLANKYDN